MNALNKSHARRPWTACLLACLLAGPGVAGAETDGAERAASDLAQAAERGSPRAMLDYGRYLVNRDDTNALSWVRDAAAAFEQQQDWPGMMEACLELVELSSDKKEIRTARDSVTRFIEQLIYAPPKVREPFVAERRSLLEYAYALRVPAAAALIGKALRDAGEPGQAFDWYLKAATMGYPPAQVQVGLMYSNGDGVDVDMEKAAKWMRPANRKKNAAGKYLLAECFLYGKGMEKNPALAVQLLQESVESHASGRSYDLLATCYLKGWGVDPDPRKAAELYHQACQSEFYNAYANLAVLYMNGTGVTRNQEIALDLLRQGVDQGENPLCMYFLGLAYREGKGVGRSKRKARSWMVRSAEAGNELAQAWCVSNDVTFSQP